jgi:predicted nucleic acid-binding Zn ribbon protein
MDERKQLREPGGVGLKRPTKPKSNETIRLGDAVRQLMEGRISRQQSRYGAVAEVWSRLLPAELSRHCRPADIAGGQLKVLADSPSYMYELRLCSEMLLRELQRRCPQARIKKIKCAIG